MFLLVHRWISAAVLASFLLVSSTHPSGHPSGAGGALAILVSAEPDKAAAWVPGELIVSLPAANAAVAADELATAGFRPLRTIPELGLAVIAAPAGMSEVAAAAELEAGGAVEWAEPNYTFTPAVVPNDPLYTQQAPYLDRLEVPAAWDFTRGDPRVIVAVLDTGIDLQHEDLRDAVWTNAGEVPGNERDDDGNGFVDDIHGWDFAANEPELDDDYGHGTHVAGIAAAALGNGKGIGGIAGGVTVMPVDVFDFAIGAYEDLIRAIIYATDNGADVINMSLGASSYSRGEEMAVNYAAEHGVVVVAAAGNQGLERYHYPAAHEAVIAVASTTASDAPSSFSNRGDWIDVAAPGSTVLSTLPGNRYGYKSGTSMATPHVAGLAALILSRNPGLTQAEVRDIIQGTAEDLGSGGFDPVYGHGRINARRALAATPPGTGDPWEPRPPLAELPLCQELLTNGTFEAGSGGWVMSGGANIVGTPVFGGEHSVALPGGPGARSTLSQTFAAPQDLAAGLLRFAFRIETSDGGAGPVPEFPYDDWLTAELIAGEGGPRISLLRTGNSADTVGSGLPWDRYIYRLEPELLDALAGRELTLVFTAQNDADSAPTSFWIDDVRFCVLVTPFAHYLPLTGW